MEEIHDISDCVSSWNPDSKNTDLVKSDCADFVQFDNKSGIFKAKVALRSYKITHKRNRKVLTTLITPEGANFMIKGHNMQSEKALVESQRYCNEKMWDNIWFKPDNTHSSWLTPYKTGEFVYPDVFSSEHGIYSTYKSNVLNSCF